MRHTTAYLEVGVIIGEEPSRFLGQGSSGRKCKKARKQRGRMQREASAMRAFAACTKSSLSGSSWAYSRFSECTLHARVYTHHFNVRRPTLVAFQQIHVWVRGSLVRPSKEPSQFTGKKTETLWWAQRAAGLSSSQAPTRCGGTGKSSGCWRRQPAFGTL